MMLEDEKQKRPFGSVFDENPVLTGNLMTLMREKELVLSLRSSNCAASSRTPDLLMQFYDMNNNGKL